MDDFTFVDMFPLSQDTTEYRLLSENHVSLSQWEDKEMVRVDEDGLVLLAQEAFRDVSHLLRSSHLQLLSDIFKDKEASFNDRFVALEMIKNAVISSEGVFPMCQDTGTAIVMGKKGQKIWTGYNDEAIISKGVFNAYRKYNLRYSQNSPFTMYTEKNTGNNLPAQIDIQSVVGDEYSFLFIAKGGGSANKSFLFQETKALLNPESLTRFLKEKMIAIGTAACPPYHIAFVIGGTSAEMTMKTVKLATAGYLDGLPTSGGEAPIAFRDTDLEKEVMAISRNLGIGAQFGGKYFALDARVIRLPRHGASCPVGLGVSCSADRNIKGKINRNGIFIEQLETDPAKYLPEIEIALDKAVPIDLNKPMAQLTAELSKYPIQTPLLLSGNIVVARDSAHARLKEEMDRGIPLPDYMKNHIVYYAGPAKTPEGYPSGSFGPTTAARMDVYVPLFQKQGASLVMLAKGNRSDKVTESCNTYGGFYLGSIGGPGARFGRDCITKVDVIAFPELGMEAVFMITVKDFPAFILVDDKGNNFFKQFSTL